MKKIYSFLALSVMTVSVFAQSVPTTMKPHASRAVESNSKIHMRTGGPRTMGAGYIDYSWLDVNDLSYVWKFNSTYTGIDTSLNYAGVAIYPFIGITDYSDNVDDFNYVSSYPSGLSFTVDTIFSLFTHENNSGTNDYIVMQLANLSGTGTLTSGSTVVWSDSLVTNTTLSSGGGWLGSGALVSQYWLPNYTTAPGQKIGMVFRYYGSKMDTMGILASCVDDGSGGTMTQATYPTSFMQYPPYINSISANKNIGYGSPAGSAGWFEAQDWEIYAYVTYNDAAGIHDVDNNATLYQNMPNPSNGSTTIRYDLAKSASVSVVFYDVTGKIVNEINEGELGAGSYNLDVDLTGFAKGSYYYALKTSLGTSLTKKMVITK